MKSFDEVARVAVIAEPGRLSATDRRLLGALGRASLPGFQVGLARRDSALGPLLDLIHVLGAGAHAATAAVAREHGLGLIGTFPLPEDVDVAAFRVILSPTAAADRALLDAGARPEQLQRWQPGVDPEAFGPGHYCASALPREGEPIHVLHVGDPVAPAALFAEVAAARGIEPRLNLVILEEDADLPRKLASGDLLVHLSHSAAFPLGVIEAQASGLPVLAWNDGAAAEIIEDGRSGVLIPRAPGALAQALVSLARRAALRERLIVGGLAAVRPRTWESSLAQLTAAWGAALKPAASPMVWAA